MKTIALLFVILWLGSAESVGRITPISPSSIADKYNDDGMKYALSHIGDVPWDRTLTGGVFYSNPPDACSDIKVPQDKYENFVLLVKKGGCSFTTKAFMAQMAKASMVIVINDDNEPVERIKLYDTEYNPGYIIQIPIVMVTKSDGEVLYNAIGKNPSTDSELIIESTFKRNQTERADMDFWMTQIRFDSYDFLTKIKNVIDNFNKKAHFHPHFAVWSMSRNWAFNFNESSDCMFNGKYCAPSPNRAAGMGGRIVLEDTIQSICIYRSEYDSWWDYAKEYFEKCSNVYDSTHRECSVNAMKSTMKNLKKVEDCIDNSYTEDDNLILKKEYEKFQSSGIFHLPTLLVNRHHVPMDHGMKEIYHDVCQSLAHLGYPLRVCDGERDSNIIRLRHERKANEQSSWGFYIVMALVAAGTLIIIEKLSHDFLKKTFSGHGHHHHESAMNQPGIKKISSLTEITELVGNEVKNE